jgi:hypothetical protein
MPQLNQGSLAAIQPELASGETILWVGQPSRSIIFHKEDRFLVPFSLLWGGFAIFWEAGALGFLGHGTRGSTPWLPGALFGIPFIVIGQYFIWGRFLDASWKKRVTHYAVTSGRIIVVVQEGSRRRLASAYIDTLPCVVKETGSRGVGTLRFAPEPPVFFRRTAWEAWDPMTTGNRPSFIDIEDIDFVYRLVCDLREKSRTNKASTS